MKTFREIIDLWPTKVALADDLGLKYDRVAQWYKRDSIRSTFFDQIVRAAKGRNLKVTYEDLSHAAALRRESDSDTSKQESKKASKQESKPKASCKAA